MDREEKFPSGGVSPEMLHLRCEIEAFNARWKRLPPGERAPEFTWDELERQLVDLAPSERQAELVHTLLAGARRFSGIKPAEMLLREVLCIAALVLEER